MMVSGIAVCSPGYDRLRVVCVLVTGLILASPVLGHHSDAGLDRSSVVALEGIVTGFSWRNPHVYFTIETIERGGERIEWELQTVAIPILVRSGWMSESIVKGDRVFVRGHPALDGRKYALLLSIENEGEILLPVKPLEPRPSAASTSTLEGIWRGDRSTIGDFTEYFDRLTLTERGAVARDEFDVFSATNPVTACIGRPTPASIVSSGLYLSEIEIGVGTIVLRNEIFDVERTVYMDGRVHPDMGERTLHGHSIGWWEGEVLIVDTTLFADHRSPYQNGVPSGAQKHVVERYRLDESGARVVIDVFLEDPEYLTEPLTSTMEWIYSPDAEMFRFDCDLEVTRHFLPE